MSMVIGNIDELGNSSEIESDYGLRRATTDTVASDGSAAFSEDDHAQSSQPVGINLTDASISPEASPSEAGQLAPTAHRNTRQAQ